MITSSKLRIIVPAVMFVMSVLASSILIWFANDVDLSEVERVEPSPHKPMTPKLREASLTMPPPALGGAFLTKPLFLAERDAFKKPVEPVFVPERKDAETSPHQVTLPEPLGLRVVGMINDNGKFLGLFMPRAGGDIVRLSVGDHYREWTLESFEADSAVFISGARSEILHIVE